MTIIYVYTHDTYTSRNNTTAIPIIIEGQFQVFQRFSGSKLVPKTVESCFVALNYYGNGSKIVFGVLLNRNQFESFLALISGSEPDGFRILSLD